MADLCSTALLSPRSPTCGSTSQPDLRDGLFFFFHLQALKVSLALSVSLRSQAGAVRASCRGCHAAAQANLELPAGSRAKPPSCSVLYKLMTLTGCNDNYHHQREPVLGGEGGRWSCQRNLRCVLVQRAREFCSAAEGVKASGDPQPPWLLAGNTGDTERRKSRWLRLAPDFNRGNFVTWNFLQTRELIT